MAYVRVPQHSISRIRQLGQILEHASSVILAISSLYTNIPNHEGMLVMAEHIRKDQDKQKIGPYILKLLELVLHSMNFTFNGNNYPQKGGTTMGTGVAPIMQTYS